MKRKKRLASCILFVLLFTIVFSVQVYAAETESTVVTEEQVQEQVDSKGKEAVSGNIFVWFLCAIAFLKASQKIDSFMSSLGINVGHTGGSMLAEAMLAGRGIAALRGGGHFSAKGGASGGGGGPGGGDGGSGGFLSGGLAGAVGRHFSRSAVNSVTGQAGGGVAAGISRKMYESSLNKGGDFANKVTGAVAKGRAATTGTMTGPTAAAAMASYFGLRAVAGMSSGSGGADGSDQTVPGGTDYAESPGVGASPDFIASSSGGFSDGDACAEPHIPSFSDVEIGGGRVTGVETTPEQPGGVQFAMYSAEQYSRPQGEFSTVEAVDGSKWYKQYATDTVDRTPYMDEEGQIKYHEKIVKTLPKPPARKERL